MIEFDGKPYLEIETELNRSRKVKANLILVSLPGMGLNHYLKRYIEAYEKQGVVKLEESTQALGLYNIFIWSRSWGEDALGVIDGFLRRASVSQKFGLGITRPWLLETEEYKKSYLSHHVYKTIYVKVFDDKDIFEILKTRKVTCPKGDVKKILDLTGGIPQLVKHLVVGLTDDTSLEVNSLLTDLNLKTILETISNSIKKCSPKVLMEMGIMDELGGIRSELLRIVYESQVEEGGWTLEVGFDLSLVENGIKGETKVTAQEKSIVEKMVSGGGKISKEEVSDIKWGTGKYDEYSDQAINKTMRRLSQKLTTCQITTIPKVGYILEKLQKNGG